MMLAIRSAATYFVIATAIRRLTKYPERSSGVVLGEAIITTPILLGIWGPQ